MAEEPPSESDDDPGKTHYYGDDCDPPHVDPSAPLGPPSDSRAVLYLLAADVLTLVATRAAQGRTGGVMVSCPSDAEGTSVTIEPPSARCARTRSGVRCDQPGDIGIDTPDGDTLWLCAEHLAELLRMAQQ